MYDPIHKTSKIKDYFFPATILFTGILISVAIFWNKNNINENLPSAILPMNISENERVKIPTNSKDPILGNPQAPITIVEFYDFQCGYCKIFAQDTLPQILNEYVKSGKIKFIFKDFSVLGEDSKTAAIAANCAFEQNKFLEFHDGLYSLKDENKIFSKESILSLAQKLNLNIFKFNDCIGLSKNKELIDEDIKEGKLSGVRGTPTIFINGIKISGAQSFSFIAPIIEQELKNNSPLLSP
ncbi:MAG: DSBA oxidoreductase [Parcubacteria group bacterium GW2011_GWD2_38_12]|nr:MAG: DSBA oxidoreductase [Parcubacteria group bacterium GW2011_GWC2_36_17]KKQ41458.1 MAG: DSBA oxidoreductase [Parcubacteria group bacterium GW2011_GWE2_37_8]KKQ51469.1 MAG: DSBA oxidoreductase [Parcubacteria group bacterium GW2011_GWD2_38_12]KKQ58706.1 MAG: DSBA oxidoreductase [Parcubacteria group bacterium GW2011_GWC1_38_17]KKQ59300.1 MAG: DSBA oxidoreductase [Parcubacteria group bacterium GW2011_GWD1_38_16]